ncbi:hypothetical protein [Desulforamulus aquiferis]|uniref:Uncharacterized protein n=1 Tax=Desulforamulus aquiferis TaxID=1397668 RepID=A0AAW7ZAE2_9FIRM|nr:hypothetical protein [Desulforamulus aquiferis]MDO7786292.1 hypothetical protein [Desulforamulus aquiferis]
MELEFCEVSHISLVTNLVGEVCEGVNEGKVAKSFSLQASKLTEEVWKEIVNYNLDPNAPCFLYFEDSSAENIQVRVVCKNSNS